MVPNVLERSSEELSSQKQTIAELAEVVASVRAGLGISFLALKPAIRKQEEQMKKCGESCEQLGKALEEISQKYITTEKNNVEKINL